MLIMSVETDSRTVCGRVLKEVLGFRPLPVLPEQFPVRRFPIPCYFIRNSLLFRNRELPSNHLKYRRLPRQKTAGSAQKWPKFPVFPCFSLLFMVTSRDRIALNCTIRHPVLQIVALQRRVRFSGGWAGFAGSSGTRDALEGLKGSHFRVSSLISIFECQVAPNKGVGADRLCGRREKKHPRGQNRGWDYRWGSGPSKFWSSCVPPI